MTRWLTSRLIARHAANVAKAHPWPSGHGAVTTRQPERQAMSDDRPPANQGWNAPGTCGGGYWRVVNGIYEMWPPEHSRAVKFGAGLTMAPATLEQAASGTEPLAGTPEQPPTNESPHLAAKYWRERQALRDQVAILTRVVQGHDRELQGLNAAITQRDHAIALKDSVIDSLVARALQAADDRRSL
jgi:hypothetical protein